MRIMRIFGHLETILATLLIGGFLSATLARLAPGFGADEQELDSRLSAESIRQIRESHAQERNILHFYFNYLKRAIHGDLGTSRSLGKPVRQLIADRLPITVRLCGLGLLVGWTVGLALAIAVVMAQVRVLDVFAAGLAGTFLSLPAAVLALLFVYFNAPASLAISSIVFPKVFSFSRNLLAQSYGLPHIITARAKGLGSARIFGWHVLPVAGPQMLALAGVSVSMALGAAIPVEALCGISGIGQLAWQAALGRDLSLLVTVTVLVTVVTLAANTGSDLAMDIFRGQQA